MTIAFLLLVVLIGIDPLHTRTAADAFGKQGGGDAFRQLSFLAVAGVCVLTSGVLHNLRKLLVLPVSITLVVAYLCVSIFWAVSPDIAVRRLMLTILLLWIVFSSVQGAGYVRTLSALRGVLLATLALNYVAVALIPSAIHMGAELMDPALAGNWRGVQAHKNLAGPTCVLVIILFLFDARHIKLAFRLVVLVAATLFLYKTSSKTSALLAGIAIAAGFMYARVGPQWRPAILTALGFIVLLILTFVPLFWDQIATLFARDDAFTGRVQIWRTLMAYAGDNWLGAGYGSFWNVGLESPIYRYTKSWVSQIYTGHNGYLDLLVQIGPAGLALAVTMTFVVPFVRLFSASPISQGQGALLVAILTFCAGHNLTESSLYDRDSMLQVILMTTVALVHVISDRSAAAGQQSAGRRPVRR